MSHLPPAHHETSKHDSLNETKVKEKQNKTIPDSNLNFAKSMTHHNQTKELMTWILMQLEEQFHIQYHSEVAEAGIADLAQVR
jgi:FKBP-type peptidyl-prolyl cis-trans isomerase (trigger factor)